MNVERATLPCAVAGCWHVEDKHCINDYGEPYPCCVECMLDGLPDEHEFVEPELPLWVRDLAVLV